MARTDRICLFTGVSGRLGREFSIRHANDYTIVGVYHRREPVLPVSELASPEPPAGGIFGIRLDLGAEGAADELGRMVLERFGSCDLVVNAAVFTHLGPATSEAMLETLDWQFYLNVSVPVRVVAAIVEGGWRHTAEENRERGRNVVNLSSTAGHVVYPGSGRAGYSATKAALDMWTLYAASELAPLGVRANVIAPDAFPARVPTESVTEAIVRYDGGTQTGDLLVIDEQGERTMPSRLEGA